TQPLTSMTVAPLLTRDYDARPALVYERLRNQYGTVAPVDLLGMPVWLALGYTEVLEILRNERGIWSKSLDRWRARAEGRVPQDWPLLPALEVNHVIFQEGQRLSELRNAWSAALRPFQDRSQPQARRLKAAVAKHADDLISLLSESGGRTGWADLSAQYTRPLPLMVVNHLLGFESAQGDSVLMDMWRVLDAGPDSAAALERLLSALSELAAAKMARPGEDFPSYMLAAQPDLTVDELSRELMMLVGVTGDHVGTLISNTVAEVIIGNAGARASLSAGLIRETVNRVAMTNPPMANLTFRFPTVDVHLGDFTIAAGDPVMLSVASAHADPVFASNINPDPLLSSRAHLAWGAGPHQCLARELATTITTVAVSRLFDRFIRLELTLPADQLPWRSSPLMRGLRSLPVNFELADTALPNRPAGHPVGSPTASESVPPEKSSRSALWRFLRGLRRGKG
ncbi:cytochrome P450, partial [Actinomadura sp. HBU206391]|uniref:cytochrome P450 n=1 Tax=Actinomadura sp. HBU206391 TaxID=2731692 RepID=UPI001C9C81A7